MNEVTYKGKGGIKASIVKDSISPDGKRITTMQVTTPKFIDAEFEKHRLISSNSSSDRAIPVSKMVSRPWYEPHDLRLNQPGMQGAALAGKTDKNSFINDIRYLKCVVNTILLENTSIHKQHLNRYLLGFSFQDKVITATEWDNFFLLRLNPAADPAIYELAVCMKAVMVKSVPVELSCSEYHLPYITELDRAANSLETLIRLSIARCARVSYLNHDNSIPNSDKDLDLYDMLLKSEHMSPFEHVARAMEFPAQDSEGLAYFRDGITALDRDMNYWSGNFKGWIQHRHEL